MGRREKPLDPRADPIQRFAFELRELRTKAGGPTYREMARQVGYSAPTLSLAAAGERLPSLPVTLAYVAACGGDRAEWERRWRETVQAEPDDGDEPAPYRGLDRFGPSDRELFFGRDELVADLLELTARRRFAALVGASGSGKSSVLRAGLIPALRNGTEDPPAVVRVITPGEHPLRTHGTRLEPSAGDGDTVIIVDQFEEIFTLCHDPAERAEFIDRLLAAREATSRLRMVIAVRADFFGRCTERRALAEALRDATLLVAPMTPAQLRDAIVKPALERRLTVERSLTARIVADVADEPGGLPLMSHALLEVWRRRRGKSLTEAAYEAIDGVRGAIAHTAEEVFGQFTGAQTELARATMLRLISPGEGSSDTSHPVERTELTPTQPDLARDGEQVLERLVRARLLTVDGTTVSLAHEALITSWPRLRGWVDQDRERMRLRRRLTDAAHTWDELGRDDGALYRGIQLSAAREAFAEPGDLNSLEQSFLVASITEDDRTQRAAARGVRRLRTLSVSLSVLLCLALLAGLLAWQQSRVSERRRIEAEARRITAVVDTMRDADPKTAMRLSVAAWRLADLPETRASLYTAAAQRDLDVFTKPVDPFALWEEGTFTEYSPDGRTLTIVGVERTERWDTGTHRRLASYPGLGQIVKDQLVVAVSHDGRTAAYSTRKGIRLWDLPSGKPTGPAFGPGGPIDAEFSPSGRTLMVDRSDVAGKPGFQVWDVSTRRLLADMPQRAQIEGSRPAVSPDDRLIAICAVNVPLQVREIRGRRRFRPAIPSGPSKLCKEGRRFQFTPDSTGLAFATGTGLRSWDVRTGHERRRIKAGDVEAIAFSADGNYVATGNRKEIQLWRTADVSIPVMRYPLKSTRGDLGLFQVDVESGVIRYLTDLSSSATVRTISLGSAINRGWQRQASLSAKFSPDGETLATTRQGRGKHIIALWQGARPEVTVPGKCAYCAPTMAFSQDGRTFAYRYDGSESITVRSLGPRARQRTLAPKAKSGTGGFLLDQHGRTVIVDREGIERWPVDGQPRTTLYRNRQSRYGGVLGLAPDGRRLVTSSGAIFDLRSGKIIMVLGGQSRSGAVAFSPDGRFLAMADLRGARVTLWDGQGRRRIAVLSTGAYDAVPWRAGDPFPPRLAFSRDSRTLAVGDRDGRLRLWRTASPGQTPARLAPADGEIQALAFAKGDTELRVVTPHTRDSTYPLAPERVAEAVCARAGGGLLHTAWRSQMQSIPYRQTC